MLAAGAAASQDAVTLRFENAGANVSLNASQTLLVRLPRNPSTGYRWLLVDAPNAALKADGLPAYEPPSEAYAKKVGASGIETWTLKPVRSGIQDLRFEYRRPWEKGGKPDRVVTYRVTVR
jgi:inhibitor of cysteine peptidase